MWRCYPPLDIAAKFIGAFHERTRRLMQERVGSGEQSAEAGAERVRGMHHAQRVLGLALMLFAKLVRDKSTLWVIVTRWRTPMSKRNGVGRGRAIERGNKSIRNIQRKISKFDPSDGCKVPTLPGEPKETNVLQGCHLISESTYLVPISTRNHVMHWRFDTRAIANAMMHENTYSYTRLPPSRIPTKKCTTRYACNWHDHELFAEIDKGNLNPNSEHHQFLLGFRAIAGCIAEWDAWLEYFESLPTAFYAKEPRAEDMVNARLMTANPYMQLIKGILKRWQNAYREQKWDSIHSCHMVATSNLRCAATSTVDIGSDLGTITLLPRVRNGELTDQYDIIGVVLKSRWTKPWVRLFQKGIIKNEVSILKGLLEQDPSQALEWMAKKMGHVAINPDDYANRDLISSESIARIEQVAASRFQQRSGN